LEVETIKLNKIGLGIICNAKMWAIINCSVCTRDGICPAVSRSPSVLILYIFRLTT